MVEQRQNKIKINASVSRYTKSEYDKLGNSQEYGGLSNAVETALNFYLGSLHKENEIKIKQLETEMSQLKNEYEWKIKQLEAEQKLDKELIFGLLTNHPELITEYNELKEKITPKKESFNVIKF